MHIFEGRNSSFYFHSVEWGLGKCFDSSGLLVLDQLPFYLTVRKQRLYLSSERSALSGLFLPEKYAARTPSPLSVSSTFRFAEWLYSYFLFKTEVIWLIRWYEYFVNIWSGFLSQTVSNNCRWNMVCLLGKDLVLPKNFPVMENLPQPLIVTVFYWLIFLTIKKCTSNF